MPQNVTAKAARRYTRGTDEGTAFVTRSGKKVQNIYELYDIMQEMPEDDFVHHVNEEKNDFRNWVYHIIKDRHLAERIAPLKDRNSILDILEKRIQSYDKAMQDGSNPAKVKKASARQRRPMSAKRRNKASAPAKFSGDPKAKEKDVGSIISRLRSIQKHGGKKGKGALAGCGAGEQEHIERELSLEFLYGLAMGVVLGIIIAGVFF